MLAGREKQFGRRTKVDEIKQSTQQRVLPPKYGKLMRTMPKDKTSYMMAESLPN